MVIEYECRKCGKIVSWKDFNLDHFCPDCKMRLRVKVLKRNIITKKKPRVFEIKASDIELDALFFKFINFGQIDTGGGVRFSSVESWILARKRVYKDYRKKFSAEKLVDFNYLNSVFKEWLLFRNNKSWTNFQRSGCKAMNEPERLAELIIMLRNDDIDVGERVSRGLVGSEKVTGIGPGLLTGLLHTFFNDKYCVWNSRTKDTLDILRCPPKAYSDIGETYKSVNRQLIKMAEQLETDITTIDGFMWFISKHIHFT